MTESAALNQGWEGGTIRATVCLPFPAHGFVALGADRIWCACCKLLPPDQLRQGPHRSTAHQRALIIKQAFGFDRQSALVRVADGDQYIADETVAADAFDRRFCIQ